MLIGAALLVLPTHPALIPSLLGGVQTKPIVLIGVGLAVLAATTFVLMRARRNGAHERWRAAVTKAVADLRSGVLSRGAWPGVLLLSAGALAGYLGLFLVAAYAAGTKASIWTLLPLLLLALMAMGLPISVGGWGPREGVAAVRSGWRPHRSARRHRGGGVRGSRAHREPPRRLCGADGSASSGRATRPTVRLAPLPPVAPAPPPPLASPRTP